MPIDYRYHIGSFVAIFVALLLGILIGIGLAPSPEELREVVADLKEEYRETRYGKEEQIRSLQDTVEEWKTLAKETTAAIVQNRLEGERVAIVLGREFGDDPLPDNLRALLKQAGAKVTSTTTITRDFVTLPREVRDRVLDRLDLEHLPGVHFRTLIAETVAEDLAAGKADVILDLHGSGLLVAGVGSDYTVQPAAVLLVGGRNSPGDGAPERIEVPMMETLIKSEVRVVACEPRQLEISSLPTYKTVEGASTVDNADAEAGRLAIVLALAGADGHFGVKDTREAFLPPIPPLVRE